MSRRLLLRHDGKALAMTYERKGERIALDFGDRHLDADVTRDGSWFTVASGGTRIRCTVTRGRRGVWVSCEGKTYLLEDDHPEAAAKGSASADELRAPMTGRVVQVAARKGASVREGDLLVTIEAMKMEFRLVAPEDGVVADVRCASGERVELGDLLVQLEPGA